MRWGPEYEHAIPNARESVGFRNILVYSYFAVQDETVWEIAPTDVPELLRSISSPSS
ncbi:MAG: DUF86 domain-containing protein [Planctomycetes bacterium]|nr:DUF86 domain-containing protein [Planctomycetota bacterium]